MQVRLLGPFEVVQNGTVVAIRPRKQRCLLALLALQRGRELSTDSIIDELWSGEPPRSARSALHTYLTSLRRALSGNADPIETTNSGYRLELGPQGLDLQLFEEKVYLARSASEAGNNREAAQLLREALSVWRGDALVDFRYEEFARLEINRLEELKADAEEDLVEAELADGNHGYLVGFAYRLVDELPLRERRWDQLMRALYRTDRHAEALLAFDQVGKVLAEIGAKPSPRLRDLAERIRLHDQDL